MAARTLRRPDGWHVPEAFAKGVVINHDATPCAKPLRDVLHSKNGPHIANTQNKERSMNLVV
jgi:hypothetical protein